MGEQKMKEKVLITGIEGFVGSHLADFLLEKGNKGIYKTIFKSTRDRCSKTDVDAQCTNVEIFIYKTTNKTPCQ